MGKGPQSLESGTRYFSQRLVIIWRYLSMTERHNEEAAPHDLISMNAVNVTDKTPMQGDPPLDLLNSTCCSSHLASRMDPKGS